MNIPFQILTLSFAAFACCCVSAVAFQDTPAVAWSTDFQIQPNSRTGTLVVNAEIPEGWNLYSTTTPRGGPKRTKITILDSAEFALTGEFTPSRDPRIKMDETFEIITEYYVDTVSWTVPIELAENVSPDELEIEMKVQAQSCTLDSGACVMINQLLAAEQGDASEPEELEETFSPNRGHVTWTGSIGPSPMTPGAKVLVTLTAEPGDDFKIYGYEEKSPGTVAQPTRIVLSKSHGWKISEINPERAPKTKRVDGELQKYYRDPISWTFELSIPENAQPGIHRFEGFVAYQNCTDEMCDPPAAAKYAFEINVGQTTTEESMIGFKKEGRYGSVSKMADRKAKERALLSPQGE